MVNLRFTWPYGATGWQLVKEEEPKKVISENPLNFILSLILENPFPTLH